MSINLELSPAELETVLIALNVEQAREMKKGTPAGRKLVTHLRDRVAAEVKRLGEMRFQAAVADDKAISRW